VNLGSHSGNQTTGGTSGSVAFPIGHSFGLLTEGTAGSIGGNGIYDVGSTLYWRDPVRGLVGGTAEIGHLESFGGANFASGGANFEGYFARITPFATAGAFGVQGSATRGYGTIGTAIYPTDNLQLALGGSHYGSDDCFSGWFRRQPRNFGGYGEVQIHIRANASQQQDADRAPAPRRS
jgi:hypothetical protein